MSQNVCTSNQQPLIAAVPVAVAVAVPVAVPQISGIPSSSSENRNAECQSIRRPTKTKASGDCLRDEEENENRLEVTRMLHKPATSPDQTVDLVVNEIRKSEDVAVSKAQRKRPRLAVELDSESKQSRSLELTLLEALLPPKPK